MKVKIILSTFILILICIFCTWAGFADSLAPNREYSTTSSSGHYAIKMIPKSDYGDDGHGVVTHYSSDKILWKTNWYARLVVLCNDGVHLVRFGPWASDQANLNDLAIAFYKRKRLLRKYFVKQLIRDRSKLEFTTSHYFWQANKAPVAQGFSKDNKTFTLVTMDGNAYTFDVSKGYIVSRKEVPWVEGYLE